MNEHQAGRQRHRTEGNHERAIVMSAVKITALCCHNALYAGLKPAELSRAFVEGVQIIETPCSGKVDPIYLLKAFEKGADCVVVLACDQRLCTTIEGSKRIHKRIERTKQLLAEAGLEPERLVLRIVRQPALKSLDVLFSGVKESIKELGPSPAG
jgi:coenzyme F420-reducing hydrogenase delta subunit